MQVRVKRRLLLAGVTTATRLQDRGPDFKCLLILDLVASDQS